MSCLIIITSDHGQAPGRARASAVPMTLAARRTDPHSVAHAAAEVAWLDQGLALPRQRPDSTVDLTPTCWLPSPAIPGELHGHNLAGAGPGRARAAGRAHSPVPACGLVGDRVVLRSRSGAFLLPQEATRRPRFMSNPDDRWESNDVCSIIRRRRGNWRKACGLPRRVTAGKGDKPSVPSTIGCT